MENIVLFHGSAVRPMGTDVILLHRNKASNITAQPTTEKELEQPPHYQYNPVISILHTFFTSKVSSPQSNSVS